MILADEDEPERNTWVTQHFRFDEIYFDHFTASLMLVQCLLADSCLDGPHVVKPVHDLHNSYAEQLRAENANQGPRVWQFYEAGMMRWYADHLDVAEVEKRLAALPLPAAAQQTYLRLVGLATQGVIAFTDSLTPEAKAMFVDIPVKTFEARTAQYAKSARIVSELATLTERSKAERAAGTQGVSDETLARLAKLRVTYEASCGKQDCTRDMLFAALTKQLFWAYASARDAPAAMAETKLLDKLDPSAQLEIADKQTKAIEAARARLARVESARKQGVDAESARATANGSVLELGDGRYVYRWHQDFKIYWESLIPNHQSVGHIDGKVAALDAARQRGHGPLPGHRVGVAGGHELLRDRPDRQHRSQRQDQLPRGVSRLDDEDRAPQGRAGDDAGERGDRPATGRRDLRVLDDRSEPGARRRARLGRAPQQPARAAT